jgi:putative selenate reductase
MEYRGERDSSGRKIPRPVEGRELEIPLDTLILAISQHSLLDFFGGQMPELNARGYIVVHPETHETSIPGVFAGGDVAAEGPSSIVKAAADGKRVAESIITRAGQPISTPVEVGEEFDLEELLIRRAHREWRVPVTHTPLDERMSFDETILIYTAEEAKAEAGRCLDCHQICSLCVGVCPNLALMTYSTEPFLRFLPSLRVVNGQIEEGENREFRADQRHQIAVLTDFCNECGNCTTFCPTAGEPYRDKPRLYLHRPDFDNQSDNAFLLARDGDTQLIEARWQGETHRLEVDHEIRYHSPSLEARLQPGSFSLIAANPGAAATEGQDLTLEACASMYVVLLGVSTSMPQVPWVESADGTTRKTRIAHPGYEE